MPFSKSVPFSPLVSLLTCNISSKWIRLVFLVLFFAVALFSLPVHHKNDSAKAQSSGPRRTQGPPSRNLPNLDEIRGTGPGTPRIMPPVPATQCRGRDEKCKRAKGKISDNLIDNQDRLLANVGIRSERDFVAWMKSGIPALSTLANLIYWPARVILDFPDVPYRDYGGALAESTVKGANPRSKTYGKAVSGGPRKESRKEYGYRGGPPLAAVQGSGIITVNPSAYQTPYGSGTAIDSPSNTGGSANINITGPGSANKTCKWSGFAGVSGQIVSIRLKMGWSVSVSSGSGGFGIDYSLDGGSSWTSAAGVSLSNSSQSSSVDVVLPNGQDLTQVQVKMSIGGGVGPGANFIANASVSNIRIEVDTAPVISNVSAGGITTSGATITWTTNENSDSQVEYGPTTAYGQSTTPNPTLVTAHSQGLSGLTGGTLYHYRVKSIDATGNLAVSGDFSFTTAPPPDITPPVISNVAAGGITTSSATITWATNENSDSQVEYGTTTAYGQSTTLNSALVTAHSQGLSGLTVGTLYHYRVKSRDAAGNLAVSGDFTFTTAPDTTTPTVTSFSPAAGATNVNANTNVTVTFSEAMNPATVNGSTVELRDPSNALVSATVSYNAASFTATLDPTASLLAGITYTARVRGGGTDPRVKDVAGNALAADVTWTFTTLSWTGWPANLNMALINPVNRIGSPGVDLLSRNYTWSLPLLSLPGRAGLDLGLALSLNSLVYTKAGSVIYFDPNQGYPAPGFSMGFPEIRNAFLNTDASAQSYLLTMPSGSRVEFRQTNTNVYEAVDSSYMLLTHDPVNSVFVLYTPDGTQGRFVDVTAQGDYKCVQIKDRQGNYTTIGYGSLAEIRTVTDTLGRVINFNYDGFNHLLSITQNWGGQTHTWATFAYGIQTIQTNFPGLTLNGTTNGAPESVLLRVGLDDGSVYSFEYNTYAQVKTIRRYAPNNSNPVNFPGDYLQLAYTTYGLPDNASSSQTDCPRITSRIDWAYDWNGFNMVTSTYAADPGYAWGQVTFPDGTIYKEFFATTGWQRGLTTQTENWSGGVRKKWTTLQWTQDNTGVVYPLNPRVTETNVYDDANNRRRTTTSYTSFGLPSDVYAYDADAATVLRRAHTDYNLSAVYTDRRIIGLPSARFLYDGANNLFSKVDYQYDLGGEYQVHQGPPVQHDTANYGSGFVQGRGNLNKIRRWDVTDPDNASLAAEHETGYNTSGSVIFTRDPLDHQTSISYADSFSDGQNNRNTYAYPTTMTDPDTFSSTIQYNFDFGALTRAQDPKGAAVTRTYDAAARPNRVTNLVTGAYTRYDYELAQRYVASFTTTNDLSSEFFQYKAFDGHGRLHFEASEHPGSAGGYKAVTYEHDSMGRLARQTNPTEVAGNWVPAGDDAAGWVWSYQAYDWKARPTVSTNQDGTTRSISYEGCGCAGGQKVVLTDEMERRKEQNFDILGRMWRERTYNWGGANETGTYSTTTNTYNIRDQVTNINVMANATGVSQNTVMTYDGHGRLSSRKRPEEGASGTTYTYYNDDTLQTSTDARGASAQFTYNARHLVNNITYATPNPTDIPASPNVSFQYDEVGNRTLMNDGAGTVTYGYDSLSHLTNETRYFSELASHNYKYEQTSTPIQTTFQIGYSYNLVGQLTQITTPTGDTIDYTRDRAGAATRVSGTPRDGVTDYVSSISYRAWGAEKSLSVGFLNYSVSKNYNGRMQISQVDDQGKLAANFTYTPDGLINTVQGLRDRRLDRSFTYDHVRRVTGTRSASAAGLGSSEPPQFQQDYGYDEFDHMTLRQGNYWYTLQNTFSATYTNNIASNEMDAGLAQDWQYDVEGNVKLEKSWKQHYYDTVGREVKATTPYIEVSQSFSYADNNFYFYDGDGNLASHTYIDALISGSPRGSSTYYLRSSVLKKNLASLELNGLHITGAQLRYNLRTLIYVNGRAIAYRNYDSFRCFPPPNLCGYVSWTIRDPNNTMSRGMDGGTQNGTPKDTLHSIDPLGVSVIAAFQSEIDAYWTPPPPENPPDPYNPPAGFYEDRPAGIGFPDSSSSPRPGLYALGCSLDGVYGPCDQILNTANKGGASSITVGNAGALGPAGTSLLASALTSATSIDGQSTRQVRLVPRVIPGKKEFGLVSQVDGTLETSYDSDRIVYEEVGAISGELVFGQGGATFGNLTPNIGFWNTGFTELREKFKAGFKAIQTQPCKDYVNSVINKSPHKLRANFEDLLKTQTFHLYNPDESVAIRAGTWSSEKGGAGYKRLQADAQSIGRTVGEAQAGLDGVWGNTALTIGNNTYLNKYYLQSYKVNAAVLIVHEILHAAGIRTQPAKSGLALTAGTFPYPYYDPPYDPIVELEDEIEKHCAP
jgi:YD repeat-containing protein